MDVLKKLNLTWPQFLKLAGLAVLALVVLSFLLNLFDNPSLLGLNSARDKSMSVAPSAPGVGMTEEGRYYNSDDSVSLSSRNVAGMPIVPGDTYTPGSDAENYEVKEYHATIESRGAATDCARIRELKVRDEIIFENASESERDCSYTFKVLNETAGEVLTLLEGMDPKELVERSYTIKREVQDYTSEIEILESKLASINETLESAVAQYDDITALATRIEDVESLAKIINSKVSILERLTEEKINVTTQLEHIQRRKAEELDRLTYTYFYVSLYENRFIDKEHLKDSWRDAVQQFVRDINTTAEDLTVGLIAFVLFIFKYAIYFFVLLLVVRFGWSLVLRMWEKKDPTVHSID